ncbi:MULTISPECIES: hypothetical protein [Paenibacillus]|uniref:Uncharacterized protein n=1 Tax=Paenibacillus validus TaxID=44253 RepID=A0A7X3CT76_9BACL|nr:MULTISPECIES: hypothetical protein [Paenibacillus]MUG70797.1 hypothetical protein [Paenibacillus validus]
MNVIVLIARYMVGNAGIEVLPWVLLGSSALQIALYGLIEADRVPEPSPAHDGGVRRRGWKIYGKFTTRGTVFPFDGDSKTSRFAKSLSVYKCFSLSDGIST